MTIIIVKKAGERGPAVLFACLWKREPTPEPTPRHNVAGFPQKAPGFAKKAPGYEQKATGYEYKAPGFARNPPTFTHSNPILQLAPFI